MSFLTSRESHAPHGIGKSIPRREDARLLTGAGQYASDFSLPGQLHAYLVRSPHAHAKIVKTDVAEAIGGARSHRRVDRRRFGGGWVETDPA